MRYIALVVLCLPALFLAPAYGESIRDEASAPLSPAIIAIGLGIESGLAGARYLKRLEESPLAIGLGLEGIAPQLSLSLLQKRLWGVHVNGSVLVSPWEFVVFSKGSVSTGVSLGFHRWPSEDERFGLFLPLNAGYF